MLTIVGWLWRNEGYHIQYRPEHANVWARMIHRHLKMPHRFVLLTDQPDAGYDPLIAPVPLWEHWRTLKNPAWGDKKQHCYVRLHAFAKEAATVLGERFVSIDLDCIVLGALDPLFDRKEQFLILKRRHSNPYNGSMWMMTAGARPQVWEDFRGMESIEAAKRFVGTDQAWLMHRLGPDEAGWTHHDGVWGWTAIRKRAEFRRRPPAGARIVFFYGGQKPWNFIEAEKKRLMHHGRTAAQVAFLDQSYQWITEAYR